MFVLPFPWCLIYTVPAPYAISMRIEHLRRISGLETLSCRNAQRGETLKDGSVRRE